MVSSTRSATASAGGDAFRLCGARSVLVSLAHSPPSHAPFDRTADRARVCDQALSREWQRGRRPPVLGRQETPWPLARFLAALRRTLTAAGFFVSSSASRAVVKGGRLRASSILPVRTEIRAALPELAAARSRSASRCHFFSR